MAKKSRRSPGLIERISVTATSWTGSTQALVVAVGLIVAWLASGPLFGYSDTWQLVINTTTTVVTFLMVFVIQRSQNKEARAMELKLNELIAAVEGASNRMIDVESLSEAELEAIHNHYRALVRMASKDGSLLRSHTVEEAETRHQSKAKTKASR